MIDNLLLNITLYNCYKTISYCQLLYWSLHSYNETTSSIFGITLHHIIIRIRIPTWCSTVNRYWIIPRDNFFYSFFFFFLLFKFLLIFGKGTSSMFSRDVRSCCRILSKLNSASSILLRPAKQYSVQNTIAKTPQSTLLSCCCTFDDVTLIYSPLYI